MQIQKSKRLFDIVVEFPSGGTRLVKVKAVDLAAAERRALKFHPTAVGVKRNAT